MMILMMISILQYSIYKIPKASFKWVPDLGTSPGHKPIIDQSCGAVLFFSMQSSSRSIRRWASRPHTVDLRPSEGRKTRQLKDTLHVHGYPWISMDIHGYPWISMDMQGVLKLTSFSTLTGSQIHCMRTGSPPADRSR